MKNSLDTSIYTDRLRRARDEMRRHGVDALILSVGHDMPYLVGYLAMPLERLTLLVIPVDGEASLIIPRLEAPRVRRVCVDCPGRHRLGTHFHGACHGCLCRMHRQPTMM